MGAVSLAEFLLARIAEDEAVARRHEAELARDLGSTESLLHSPLDMVGAGYMDTISIDFTRVLAECEAKRQIVAACTRHYADDRAEYTDAPYLAEDALEALAAVYADHPDYDETWRP